MKILLINGSPRKNGCTNRALLEIKNKLADEGIESEIFWIGTSEQGCTSCYSCKKTGTCVFDDNVRIFAEMAKSADGFVFGSPVYYGAPAGGLLSFMDRLFFSASANLKNKPVATVVSCRRGGATSAFSSINMFYTMCNMPVVSSQYWNQVHGNSPEEVEQDEEGLQTMRTLASNMAWLLKCIEAGKNAGIVPPAHEKRISTNFIR